MSQKSRVSPFSQEFFRNKNKPLFDPPQYDDSRFAKGSIKRIKLKDFVAFDKIIIYPGPGPNLILGTNGSGKSSIVAAIGICLGTNPECIIRGSKYSSYIKHGKDQAYIKILLSDKTNIEIWCTIYKNNTIKWMISQSKHKWKDLKLDQLIELMQEYSISIDNLCMFLPQERVKEFAILSPSQLLSETLRSISPIEHSKMLEFMAIKTQIMNYTKRKEDLEKIIHTAGQEINTMQISINRLNQLEQEKRQLEVIKAKICDLDHIKEEYELEMIKKGLKQEKVLYNDLNQKISSTEQELSMCESQIIQTKALVESSQIHIITFQKEIKTIIHKVFVINEKLKTTMERLKNCENRARLLKEQILSLEGRIKLIQKAKISSIDLDLLKEKTIQYKESLRLLKLSDQNTQPQISEISEHISGLRSKLNNAQKCLNNVKNQKIQVVNTIGTFYRRKDICDVFNYIQDNGSKFCCSIYGPICAEMSFDNIDNCRYIESLIDRDLLFSFLVQNCDDFNILETFIQTRGYTKISILKASNTQAFKSIVRPNLEYYGISLYASDMFIANPIVKGFLNSFFKLDTIPIFSKFQNTTFEQLMNNILPQKSVNKFFYLSNCYKVHRSRYSENVTFTSYSIRESRLWSNVASENLEIIEKKISKYHNKLSILQKQREDIQTKSTEFIQEITILNNNIEECNNKLMEENNKNNHISKYLEQIENLKVELDNESLYPYAHQGNIKKFIEKKASLVKDYYQILSKFFKETIQLDTFSYIESRQNDQKNLTKSKLDELRKETQVFLERNSIMATRYHELKKISKNGNSRSSFQGSDLSMYDSLPDDINYLNSLYTATSGKISSIQSIDSNIIAKYEKAISVKLKSQSEIDELNVGISNLINEYRTHIDGWIINIEKYILKISNEFSTMMKECGYEGFVKLSSTKSGEFEEYYLELFVAFAKEASPVVLSAFRQSGGERSVSTLLYLLALQSCTTFPFRVIDEINQGMDEENELSTFSKAMEIAMKMGNYSQYFLVTPKLHPGISIPNTLSVILVMSGPFIDEELSEPILFRKYK